MKMLFKLCCVSGFLLCAGQTSLAQDLDEYDVDVYDEVYNFDADSQEGENERLPRPLSPPRRQQAMPGEIQPPGGLGVWLDNEEELAGARIVEVDPGSPADVAGLRFGDRIMTIGDEYVDTGDEVARIISNLEPGDPVRILFRRGGRQFVTTVRLSTRGKAIDEFDGNERFPLAYDELYEPSPLVDDFDERFPLPDDFDEPSPVADDLYERPPRIGDVDRPSPLADDLNELSPLADDLYERPPLQRDFDADPPLADDPYELYERPPLRRDFDTVPPLVDDLYERPPLVDNYDEDLPLADDIYERPPLRRDFDERPPLTDDFYDEYD